MTTQLTPLAQKMYDLLSQYIYLATWHIADELGIEQFGLLGLPENEGSEALQELLDNMLIVELPNLKERYQVSYAVIRAERNDLKARLEAVTAERDALLAACKSALSDHKAGFYSLSRTTLQRVRAAIRKAEGGE